MQRLAFALIAIALGGAVFVSMVLGAVRRRQADRARRLFLALAQELKLQTDFSAHWGELPLPIATGNVEGTTVRIESKLYRAKLPWHVRTHVEASRRDRHGPVGTIGDPTRIKAPGGATARALSDGKGGTLKVHATDAHILEEVLPEELVGELIALFRTGGGLVLHQDRVEFVDAPITSDAQRAHIERVARVACRIARKLNSRAPKSALE